MRAKASEEPPFDNESLATAYAVPNPTKSWAIYAELHEGGEAQYYRLAMEQGEKLRLMNRANSLTREREVGSSR